jgi:hypothetical protein
MFQKYISVLGSLRSGMFVFLYARLQRDRKAGPEMDEYGVEG